LERRESRAFTSDKVVVSKNSSEPYSKSNNETSFDLGRPFEK
jgi:hypothetical protein